MSTKEFLAALYPQWSANIFAEVRAFKNDTPQQHWFRSATDIINKARELKATHDVYIGVGARKGKKGSKEGVAYVAALWVDLDVPLPEARKRLAEFPLPPSAIVASGHGAHSYWFLREPFTIETIEDRNRVEAANRGLAQALGADSAWDICRVLRMPDTVNRKNGEALGVKLILFEPERRYNLSDFDTWAMDAKPEPETVSFTNTEIDAEFVLAKATDGGISEDTRQMIVEGYRPEGVKSRSERDQSVISRLVIVGLNDDEIRALFTAYPVGDKFKERGDGYLALSIGKARASQAEAPDPATGARSWEAVPVFRVGQYSYSGPSLPEVAWQPPFDLYLAAVTGTTEAASEHHFGAALAVIGAFLGRRVSFHYGRKQYPPTNAMLIGPTNDKKTTAQRRAAEDLLPLLSPSVGVVKALNSAEGLLEWLAKQDMKPQELADFIKYMNNTTGDEWRRLHPEHRRGLAVLEEFAAVLQKTRMEGSSGLIQMLTELYDMPSEKEPPLRARRICAEAPTLGVLAASTPDWFIRNLKEIDIAGGAANRFAYFTGATGEPIPLPPKPDGEKLRRVAEFVQHAYERWPRGTEFKMDATATGVWEEFYMDWTKRCRDEGDVPTSAVEKRVPEHAVKLALTYAALNNEERIINEVQMSAAVGVAAYLRDSIRFAFADRLDTGETLTTKMENRILALLKDGGMGKRDLQQRSRVKNAGAFEFNRAYEALVKARAIHENTESKLVELIP